MREYTIQFFKVDSPLQNLFWQVPPIRQKTPTPFKIFFENQNVPR